MQPYAVVLRRRVGSLVLAAVLLGAGTVLAAWKHNQLAAERSAVQPEPVEVVTVATAVSRSHRDSTTAIGTVLALESITLRNELPGTVRHVSLTPGAIVEAGTVLVALDTSVETAELRALQAQAVLAESTLRRHVFLKQYEATSEAEVEQARAQKDVMLAQVERLRASIAKKVIRAPFRARVGLADVHVGQYLNEGVQLTTLQGVADEVNVDFSVPQSVAAGLKLGSTVDVVTDGPEPIQAELVAVDAKVDPGTRNAMVRARIKGTKDLPSPGASVRVQVPLGVTSQAVAIPATALRKGPAGDHVWVLSADAGGALRAHERQVTSGPVLGDDTVLVLKGLEPGEQVAASGSFKLREAVKVQATPTAASARL